MRTDVIRRETLRYLGLGSAEPDSKTLELVNKAIELLSERCRPRSTSRIVEISAGTEEIRLEGGTVIHSESLARVMAGCSRMLVFGATLGTEADILIRRETAVNIAMGAVMQNTVMKLRPNWTKGSVRKVNLWETDFLPGMEILLWNIRENFSPFLTARGR